MAIAKCECGFLKKVADENIGKKGKCPQCQKVITVASEKDNDAPPVKNTVTPEPTKVVNQEPERTENIEWHFSLDGKRFGPVSDTRILELIKRKKITEHAMVWNKSMPEWENVLSSKFADLIRDPNEPPPLSGDAVNNTIVWFLAFAIILGLFIEGLISGLTGISQDYLFFITLGLNIFLCTLDEKKLTEAGHDTSDMGSVWLVPVYLFKRAKKLGHNYAYFIVWCVIFGLYLFE